MFSPHFVQRPEQGPLIQGGSQASLPLLGQHLSLTCCPHGVKTSTSNLWLCFCKTVLLSGMLSKIERDTVKKVLKQVNCGIFLFYFIWFYQRNLP